MGKQVGFYVDQASCMGCKTCQVSCKDKNDLKVGQLWRRVYEVSGGGFSHMGKAISPDVYAFYLSISCNHCADPACVKVCPTGARTKRDSDGVVLIDTSVCIGCRYCEWACPYQAPQFNPDTGKMGGCNTCEELRAQGQNPICVDACPMRALEFGTMEELQQKHPAAVKATGGFPDPAKTQPSVLFNPHPQAYVGRTGEGR